MTYDPSRDTQSSEVRAGCENCNLFGIADKKLLAEPGSYWGKQQPRPGNEGKELWIVNDNV